MKDSIQELDELVRGADARVTFDRGRDITKPCTFCGKPPEMAHDLVDLGTYGNGEMLTRPVCAGCMPVARLKASKNSGETAGTGVPQGARAVGMCSDGRRSERGAPAAARESVGDQEVAPAVSSGSIESVSPVCRACSECDGQHHWLAHADDPAETASDWGGYICKHCDARCDMCERCSSPAFPNVRSCEGETLLCEECVLEPYVCPGCYTVGGGPCAPGCIDAEIEADREDARARCQYERDDDEVEG